MRGSVKQIGQTWYAVVSVKRPDGTWTKKWTSFRAKSGSERDLLRAKRDAEREARHQVALQEGGGTIATTRETVSEYLDRWIRGYASTIAPTTAQGYRDIIHGHLIPELGSIRLAKLGPQALREYIDRTLRAGLSPTSVRYHMAVLRVALNQAVSDGILPRNVVTLVKLPMKAAVQPRFLDTESALLFLGEARKSSPHYRLYHMALLTGMRQGELAGLRWENIDFVTGRAGITQTFYRLGGRKRDGTTAQQLFKEPKSKTSRRSVPLAPQLITELLTLRDEQQARKRKLGQKYHDHRLVFCQDNGKPLHFHNLIREDFREVLTRAGVQQVRFHDLRHSAASLLLRLGVPIKIVQELLGHSSMQITADTYSHAVESMSREAIDALGKLLSGPAQATEAVSG